MKRLAIITTHPIQYNAPLFKLLAERGKIQIKVFYTWGQTENGKYDPDFKKYVKWDIPLLDGYESVFMRNISWRPGADHFCGVICPTLNREITLWRPDAVMVFGWCFYSHLSAMAYFKKKLPVFFRGDSTLLDEAGLSGKARKIYLPRIYSYVDSAFYVGANNKRYFLKYGLSEDRLVFAPHAVDNERFGRNMDANRKEALAWRRSMGIRDEDVVFLFAGKLIEKKSPLMLMENFKKLPLKHVYLVFVGNGSLEGELKKRAGDRIRLIDFQNQSAMPLVYQLGDIFVLPSRGPGETWGLAVNEAMASGLPVLVSDRCGCAADLVKEGINGYIFGADNESELAEKMRLAAEDKSKLKEMAAASRALIRTWDFKSICEAFEKRLNAC